MYQRNGQHFVGVDILPSLPGYARHKALAIALALLVAMTLVSIPASAKKPAAYSIDVVAPVFGESSMVYVSSADGATARQSESAFQYLWAHAECHQDGGKVFEQYELLDVSGTASITFGPTRLWTAGSADCVVEVLDRSHRRAKVVATTRFVVSG